MLDSFVVTSDSNDISVSDDDLVKEAQYNPQAFAVLYRRYATRLFRYIYNRVGNRAEAEDLTAVVFTQVIEGLAGYTPRGLFAAWLFTIARRRVADFLRQERQEFPLESLEHTLAGGSDLLAGVIEQERLERVRQAISSLDETSQELLRLRFAAELEYRTISRVLNRNEAWLRLKVHRLLIKLRKQLES